MSTTVDPAPGGGTRTGCLFLVVGNSGSGKDSLIRSVLEGWPPDVSPPRVPRRCITRPPHPTEPFQSVDSETFQRLLEEDRFCLSWQSYGLDYGVPEEAARWLEEGRHVLVNVSRQVVPLARQRFPRVRVVLVSVPLSVASERIRSRGREDGDGCRLRLARAAENPSPEGVDVEIDNSGGLEAAALRLRDYLFQVERWE